MWDSKTIDDRDSDYADNRQDGEKETCGTEAAVLGTSANRTCVFVVTQDKSGCIPTYSENLPIEYCIGDCVGILLDPSRILQEGATCSVLL